jgi:hypothetical protein
VELGHALLLPAVHQLRQGTVAWRTMCTLLPLCGWQETPQVQASICCLVARLLLVAPALIAPLMSAASAATGHAAQQGRQVWGLQPCMAVPCAQPCFFACHHLPAACTMSNCCWLPTQTWLQPGDPAEVAELLQALLDRWTDHFDCAATPRKVSAGAPLVELQPSPAGWCTGCTYCPGQQGSASTAPCLRSASCWPWACVRP